MFNELQHILNSQDSYDFESQVILNRNVIISAYIRLKSLRDKHGFDIDFEEPFWKASGILQNYGIYLPRFYSQKPVIKSRKTRTSFKSILATG